ncbi:MAG TPA: DUF2145 domain-containing protein [Noviherbaspirillum sp.]|nr:DUF2145 domain-containing protein [Noviherbaspirillum sp.]
MTTRIALAVAAGMLIATAAHAGRSCEQKRPTAQTVERGLVLAGKTQEMLESLGQKVVVLARAGQDLTKYGVHYSHLGLAYRQPDGKGGHVWRVVHKLNHCGTAEAAIYRQGLGEFFLDDLWRYEAAFSMLAPEMQDRLLAVLQDNKLATAMNYTPYSIVSYAWGRTYQQSNQWAIETIASAMEPSVRSRVQAQAWLQLRDYRPATLKLDALTRLGGRISAANVAFDDHPFEKRFSDRIETVTVDSVFAWLERSRLGSTPVTVDLR